MRERVDPGGEDLRTEQDAAEGEQGLGHDEPPRRPVRIEPRADPPQVAGQAERVEGLPLLEGLLGVELARRGPQDQVEVQEVRRKEDPAEHALRIAERRDQRDREGDGVHDEEEAEVARRVGPVDTKREPAAALTEQVGRQADEQHDERPEHERRAEDGTDPDVVSVDALGEEDGHDRHERLRCRGPDGGEDAAGRALGHPERHAKPFDAVGEQLRADEDEGERDQEEQRVDRCHASVDRGTDGLRLERRRPRAAA